MSPVTRCRVCQLLVKNSIVSSNGILQRFNKRLTFRSPQILSGETPWEVYLRLIPAQQLLIVQYVLTAVFRKMVQWQAGLVMCSIVWVNWHFNLASLQCEQLSAMTVLAPVTDVYDVATYQLHNIFTCNRLCVLHGQDQWLQVHFFLTLTICFMLIFCTEIQRPVRQKAQLNEFTAPVIWKF